MKFPKKPLLFACSVLASGCLHLTLHRPAPLMPPTPDYVPLAVVSIDPIAEWTETSLTVREGERLIIRARGNIRGIQPDRQMNPDGRGWSSFGVGEGGLVGRIGDGHVFDIGARTHLFPNVHARPPHVALVPPSLRMRRDGLLFLGFKAWKSGKFSGLFTVTIWAAVPSNLPRAPT